MSYHKIKRILKTCLFCNKEFKTNKGHAFFCNQLCNRKAKESGIYTPSWKDSSKTCINCNKNFTPKNFSQIYCTKDCLKYKYNIGRIGLRFQVFKRDNFTCTYCGRNPKEDKVKLHIDHIFPESLGGLSAINNYTTACAECNIGKSNQII